MLPPPYRWRVDEDAGTAFLDYQYGNVAHVQAAGGRLTLTIRYQGTFVSAPCASLRQGMRYAERWITARGAGWPGLGPARCYVDRHGRRIERW